jgi:PIN domain nuclease of toxin-antitoxin system
LGSNEVIVLDTHIWVWWVTSVDKLSVRQAETIRANESDVIGVSAISCWEIAKLASLGRLELSLPLENWMDAALRYPGVTLLPLTAHIAIASTRLPGEFHNDPADQIIVATARAHDCPLLTRDGKILKYSQVTTIG